MEGTENMIPAKKIDLAKMRRNRPPSSSSTQRLPMASDTLFNSTEKAQLANQLISPPPEETLHFKRLSRGTSSTPVTATITATIAKRKRTTNLLNPADSTTLISDISPNPKPRKQYCHSPSPSRSSSATFDSSPTQPCRRSLSSNDNAGHPETPTRFKGSTINQPGKSPHADNPDADYLPPLPSRLSISSAAAARRLRRQTPIPAYEPPQVIFTPPRVVIATPVIPISKSSKRKSVGRRASTISSGKDFLAKLEMPPIDLSTPMPPASPTDDPLLLSGPPELELDSVKSVGQRQKSASTAARIHPPIHILQPAVFEPMGQSLSDDIQDWRKQSLPPSSDSLAEDENMQDAEIVDWTTHTEPLGSTDLSSLMMDVDLHPEETALPMFDFANAEEVWTDSDDEVEAEGLDSAQTSLHTLSGAPAVAIDSGEGEYSGRWTAFSVRTKMDPPSSATRDRMELWGRPITPFPKKIGKPGLPVVGEENEKSPEVAIGKEDKQEQEESGEMQKQVQEKAFHYDDGAAENGHCQERTLFTTKGHIAVLSLSTAGDPVDFSETSTQGSQETKDQHDDDDDELRARELSHPCDEKKLEYGYVSGNKPSDRPSASPVKIPPFLTPDDPFNFDFQAESSAQDLQVMERQQEEDEKEEQEVRELSLSRDDEEMEEYDGSSQKQAGLPSTSPSTTIPFFTPSCPFDFGFTTGMSAQEFQEEHQLDDEEEERQVRELSIPRDDEELEEDDDGSSRVLAKFPSQPLLAILPFPTPGGPFDFGFGRTPSQLSQEKEESVGSQVQEILLPREDKLEDDCFSGSFGGDAKVDVVPLFKATEEEKNEGSYYQIDEIDWDGETSEENENEDPSVESEMVKISSADPRAAAKAAAILKQHDYECYTQIMLKQRQRRRNGRHTLFTSPTVLVKNGGIGGGVGVYEGGVDKHKYRRKSSSGTGGGMGVIGDKVYIPGSPVLTLPELLMEAEQEVALERERRSLSRLSSRSASPIKSLATLADADDQMAVGALLDDDHDGPGPGDDDSSEHHEKEWTKEDWKLLDICFTDERMAIGTLLRVNDASACLVDNDEHGGNHEQVLLAAADDVETERVVERFFESIVNLNGVKKEDVRKWGSNWERESLAKRVEALRAKQRKGIVAPSTTPAIASGGGGRSQAPQNNPSNIAHTKPVPAMTIRGRMKGFISSYLPTLSKAQQQSHTDNLKGQMMVALPLPPKGILERPRKRVETPPPGRNRIAERVPHPKEVVGLRKVEGGEEIKNKRMRVREEPRRMVQLVKVGLPEVKGERDNGSKGTMVARRSSVSSVKDLVKCFEEKEKETVGGRRKDLSVVLRRVRSGLNSGGDGRNTAIKPMWRP